MKKLIFLIISFSFFYSSCKKDELKSSENACVSDCFEISGKVINGSTNMPEANRNINVKTVTNVFPYIRKDIGDVTTNANGEYLIKISKWASFIDTANLNLILTLGSKEGYFNDYYFNEHFLGNLNVYQSYVKDITVFQKANLEVRIKNINPTDSVFVFDLTNRWEQGSSHQSVIKMFAPGELNSYSLSTVVGLQSNIEFWFQRNGAPSIYIMNDSIICNLNDSNTIEININ